MGDAGGARTGRRSVLSRRVVGRDDELSVLADAVTNAAASRGRVVFVAGEAGIGKTRVAHVTAALAERHGLRVLRGRAVQSATPVAYRPLTEALCSAVRSDRPPGGADLAPFRSALGRLIPEWRAEESIDHSVVDVAEAVVRFLRAVAGARGCLVVLEDMHWADAETLAIIEYVADNIEAERVACVCTLRVEQQTPALALARTLHARRACEVLELPRLSEAEVDDMVRSCLGIDDVPGELRAFAARADGVPFLVEELLAVAVASGLLVDEGGNWVLSPTVDPVVPLTFTDSMRRRLAALDEDARTVLLAAAVLGRRFDWQLLPPVTGLSEQDVLAALRAAVDGQIVALDAEPQDFRFRHALSRDAVLGELLPPERALLCTRALEAVEEAHPDLAGDWCERAAELAEGAGDRARAAELFLEVGRRALAAAALASAETTLARASRLSSEDDLRTAIEECLLQVLSLAGKSDEANEVGTALLARFGQDPDRAARRAEVHLRVARASLAATRFDEARRNLRQALTLAIEAHDDLLAARVKAVEAQAMILDDEDRARSLAREALDAADRLDLPDVACEALEILGRCERPHDLAAAEAAFARAYDIARDRQLTVWRVRALHELGTIDLLRGSSLARLEDARDLAAGHGALATAAVVDVQLAAALMMRDDPNPAMPAARRAAELAERYRMDQTLAAALAFQAHVHARAGRRVEMDLLLEEARARSGGTPDIDVICSFTAGVGAFVEEDRPAALGHLREAVAASLVGSGDQSSGPAGGVHALVATVAGELGAADALSAEGPAHFIGRAYLGYAQAVAAGRAGDMAGAVARMAEAGHLLRSHEWYRQYGRRLVAEAAVADGWGDPAPWLREALAFFDERGEEAIASACRSLLRKAGAPVPRKRGETAVPSAFGGLGITAREVEVLRLLGEGLSNKEIAARLYLSPRTVERHIANLTAKIDVQRRSELVAFAARAAI